MSDAEHDALIQDIDITVPGILFSGVATAMMSVVCLFNAPGWYFNVVVAVSMVLNLFRILLVVGLARGWLKHTPAVTDVHVLATLIWAGVLGAMTGGMEASNATAMQVTGAMSSLGFQGLLCARNYPAPRFAMTIVLLIDLPFMAGSVLAADHWLIMAVVLGAPWLAASASTVKRFQKLSLESYVARFASFEKARRDPLTATLNRLGLEQVCEDPHLPETLTMFCLDLDGFKTVNDTLGHQAGDKLLQLVAQRLRRCLRDSDVLARFGGDEFVIIAPLMEPADAELLAARLIEKVAHDPYALDGGVQARIGVSAGFACRPYDAVAMDELRMRADEALYAAKREGKGVWRRARQGGELKAAG
jgi:diguanylate cyclase (GGDEF)-like protein